MSRFQDESYLITSDVLSATRDENDELTATAKNAKYQDFAAGLGGANGSIQKLSLKHLQLFFLQIRHIVFALLTRTIG